VGIRQEVVDFSTYCVRNLNVIYLSKLYEKHWNEEFQIKEVKKYLTKLEEESLKLPRLDTLNEEELASLGFLKFDESGSRCIPAYMRTKAIADGFMSENTDTDVRFGMFFNTVKPVDLQ
jgi:hypothetical protein